jgi:hypothetical protein
LACTILTVTPATAMCCGATAPARLTRSWASFQPMRPAGLDLFAGQLYDQVQLALIQQWLDAAHNPGRWRATTRR